MIELLLLSSSATYGGGYLEHGIDVIREILGGRKRLAFVPFALANRSGYTKKVAEALDFVSVDEVQLGPKGKEILENAEAFFVGGGNTFRLLDCLDRSGLLEVIRRRALSGVPYIGASAGTNIAAPTIKTTNDMPIVEPRGFAALGLVPFQINPHYMDAEPNSRHMGETREQRLEQYLEENDVPVVGLREGAWLRRSGASLSLGGTAGARIFRSGQLPQEVPPGTRLDVLL
jgi:dipeptidase E